MLLLGLILGLVAINQVLSLLYAQKLKSNGHIDVERAYRGAASNSTVLMVLLTLFLWPSPWHREPPFEGVYSVVSQNLKPRDSQGRGWLAPQKYKTKLEYTESQELYSMVHKTLMAAVMATLLGMLAGALTRVFAANVDTGRPPHRPPSGPFQSRGY